MSDPLLPVLPIDVLSRRFAEAIAWCLVRARFDDPARSLRSLVVGDTTPWSTCDDVRYDVDAVVKARAAAMSRLPSPTWASWTQGRVLVFRSDDDLACGGAMGSSRGFFDVHNAPPCDSWIDSWITEDERPVVLAFVPAVFVDVANIGIVANPEGCIFWLDDADDAVKAAARALLHQPLLVVEDRFAIQQLGLILTPHLDVPLPSRFTVRLTRPDGTTVTTTARCHLTLGGRGPHHAVVLPLEKQEVPVGTSVWWVLNA